MENIDKTKNDIVQVSHKLNIILLLAGRFISNIGTVSFNFALGLYVLDITKSAAAFSMIISFAILPGVLINILAGVYVDKHNKKKIIVISDILAGISVIGFMFIFKAYSTALIVFIIYVIILNSIQAFFTLSLNAAIPNIVGKDNVAKANSAFQGFGAIIQILGPVAGAILYKYTSMQMIFFLNAISYIIAGIGEMFLKMDITGQIENVKTAFKEDIKEVFAYLNKQQILKFLLSIAVVLNSILNPLVILVLQFVTYRVIKVSGFQLSLIESSWAAGTIIGAIFVMTRKNSTPILKKFFLLLEIQAVLIILWFFPRLHAFDGASKWLITILYVILIFAYGMLNTIQNIPLLTHFQLKVPEQLRGRLFGVFFTALNISTPIGMWVFGFILQKVDWIYVPTISGIVVFILCIILRRNRHYRQFISELDVPEETVQEVQLDA